MNSTQTADIIIIGGGIIGLSIAYNLARRKAGRIVVLERETLGGGSTGRSVASIDLFSLQPAAIALQVRAYEIFATFEERLGGPCGLAATGCAILAGPEQALLLKEAAAVTAAAGIELSLLTPEAFAGAEPAASVEDLALICHIPRGGHADPMLALNTYAAAARRLGVAIRQQQPVTGLAVKNGRVIGVETGPETIAAPVVVCAAGPWSRSLLQSFGLAGLGLYAVQHPVVALARPPSFGPPHLSILDLAQNIYARPETGPLTLAGSLDPAAGYDPVEPEDHRQHLSSDYILWTVERLARRYPRLEEADIARGWTGLLTISPDWQPLLGAIPEPAGLFCAAGFSGQGFKISPAAGDLMAGLIVGEAEAAALLHPFRPTRFAAGQPLTTSNVTILG